MSNPVNDWITAAFHDWATDHPLFSWLIVHPIVSLVLLILTLMLFGGLFGVIGRLSENLWLVVLRLPLQFLQVLLKPLSKLTKGSLAWVTFDANTSKGSQIQAILKELEVVRQKETELLEKLQKLTQSM